jgi:hypothetical protein
VSHESTRAGWKPKPQRTKKYNTNTNWSTHNGKTSWCGSLGARRRHEREVGTTTCHSIQKTCGSQYSMLAVRCACRGNVTTDGTASKPTAGSASYLGFLVPQGVRARVCEKEGEGKEAWTASKSFGPLTPRLKFVTQSRIP